MNVHKPVCVHSAGQMAANGEKWTGARGGLLQQVQGTLLACALCWDLSWGHLPCAFLKHYDWVRPKHLPGQRLREEPVRGGGFPGLEGTHLQGCNLK